MTAASTIQAARTEISQLATPGVAPYDWLPGSVETPSMVVGMPRSVDELSFRLTRVELPVHVVAGGPYNRHGEETLIDLALTTAAALRAAPAGDHYRTLQVSATVEFGTITIGTAELLAATLNTTFVVTTEGDT